MVFFVVTRAGYDELQHSCGQLSQLWAASDVLTSSEVETLRAAGTAVTVFNRGFDPADNDAIEGAIHTIAQHHPGMSIWVERKVDVVKQEENDV